MTISTAICIKIRKTLANIFVQFSTLIFILINFNPCGIFEKMTFSQILNEDFEKGKLLAAVNSQE